MDLKIFYNRYQVLKKIGEGGLGTVYLVFDSWTGKKCALKLLHLHLISTFSLKLFQKEFQLLQYLKHPGLVEVYDFFVTEAPINRGGYTMEFIPGKPLFERGKALDLKLFLPIAIQICQILDFIHTQGIIHCDLKPENFLILDSKDFLQNQNFQVKLMDFGLAYSQQELKDKKVKGTLEYLAPEVLKGENFNFQADLYSLGVIFYQALTGKLPFIFSDPAWLISAHLEQKPISPREINPQIPSDLEKLILKLLEKEPHQRISKVAEVQRVLESLSNFKLKENVFLNYLYFINYF